MSEYPQPHPYIELAVGGELRIPYKGSGEPTKIVIGRNPTAKSVSEEEIRGDDLRVKINDAERSVSRRALELSITAKQVVLRNIGSNTLRWRTEPSRQWQELTPGGIAKATNTIYDMRNFEIQLGHRFLIRAGRVGGREKALQSLILR